MKEREQATFYKIDTIKPSILSIAYLLFIISFLYSFVETAASLFEAEINLELER